MLILFRLKAKFFISGSEDCTLKLWMLPSDLDPAVTMEIHAVVTERAHEKTISSVVVAPNDKFVATGSMDKTAKVCKTKIKYLVICEIPDQHMLCYVYCYAVNSYFCSPETKYYSKTWI